MLIVDDGQDTELPWQATGEATLTDPATVGIELTELGPASGPGVRLSAPASTGIVAAESDKPWPGVTDLALPFPQA